jgi:hypothetical protein
VPTRDHCRRKLALKDLPYHLTADRSTLTPRESVGVVQPLAGYKQLSKSLWLFGRITMISLTSFSKMQTLPSDRCSSWQGTSDLHIPLLHLDSSFISTLLKWDYIAAERFRSGDERSGVTRNKQHIFRLSCTMCRTTSTQN